MVQQVVFTMFQGLGKGKGGNEDEEERKGGKEITTGLPGISPHSWHLLREVDTVIFLSGQYSTKISTLNPIYQPQ